MADRIFLDRAPNNMELERLRLMLSTFQDGSGQLNGLLPGWRDFERASGIAFGGVALESKYFLDVVFPMHDENPASEFYGIDCKMKAALNGYDSLGEIYIEATNASSMLWKYLNSQNITEATISSNASESGQHLISAMEDLKSESSQQYPKGYIDNKNSYYLSLLYSRASGEYQLFQLPLALPMPTDLRWEYIETKRSNKTTWRLVGHIGDRKLYEWYGGSGGQFKYYAPSTYVIWKSERFRLEPLGGQEVVDLATKASLYYPKLWPQ